MSGISSTGSLQSKLADLHIFVVPVELWLDKYRTAFNNVALESVSAGFVRVHPELTIHHLRESLAEQLGEEVIPEDFVILRSVGRCMAIVKENQEHLLKVKDFLPPIAYSPEVFLLPGSHETYARPSTDPNNVVIATQGHTTAGLSTTNHFLPLINQQNLVTQQGYLNQQDYHDNQPRHDKDYGYHRNIPDMNSNMADHQNNKLRQSQRDSFDSDQINSSLEDNDNGRSMGMRRISGESEDSGYNPQKQKKSSRESTNQKTSPKSGDDNIGRILPETKTVKIIEPQVIHNMPYQGPDGHLMSPPTPIPTGRVIASPVPGPRKSKNETTGKEKKKKNKNKEKQRSRSSSLDRQRAKNLEDIAEKLQTIPAEQDEIPTIEDVEERSKYAQFPSPAKSTRSPRLYANENGLDSGIADDFNTSHTLNDYHEDNVKNNEDLNYSKVNGFEHKGGDDMDNQRDVEQEQNELLNKENSDQSDKSNIQRQVDKNNNNNRQNAGKNTKNITRKPKKTVRKPVKKPADDLDEKLKKLKKFDPPPIAVPDPGSVTFEKDTHSAKDRKQRIIEELRGQLRKAKNERVDLEKQRDAKVRRAKSLQTQTLQKRNQAKNIWKKKFFDEKRKTAPLEEQLNRLRYDVEVQHKAIVDLLENKDRDGNKGSKDQDNTPSEKTNQLMLLARIQNEVEELKHKIEEMKMRLASEMKLRDNAQRELKQLREDLIEKKINLTLTKSQKSLAVLNATNIIAQ